jgi:hypothetical protein
MPDISRSGMSDAIACALVEWEHSGSIAFYD